MTAIEAKNPLWKRNDCGGWFYTLYHPVTGRRIRKSTGTDDYDEARRIYQRAFSDMIAGTEPLTLISLIRLYQNTETNPRYRAALTEGTSYGKAYAEGVAGRAKHLEALLGIHTPKIIRKDIRDVTKGDIRLIRQAIIDARGQTRSSQQMFSELKTMLRQASEDGIIDFSPAQTLKNITYKEKERMSFTPDIIRNVLLMKDSYPDKEEWWFFAVIATTGMRMSEALALSDGQIYKGTLTINRAIKTNNPDDIGLPKCNLIRIIPLSELTLSVLSEMETDESGRYFHHSRAWGTRTFRRIREAACSAFPSSSDEYKAMTSHTLRHSLNTNLLVSGISPLLAAEYLSWNHQMILDMQERYTHIYAESLRPVADKIDELYRIPATAAAIQCQV